MGQCNICAWIVGLKNFIKSALSESDGSGSTTRILMFMFSIFTLGLLWRIFYHIFRITDITQLQIWLGNIPLLITSLMGLIALPYTINKGTGAIADLFAGITMKGRTPPQQQQNNTQLGTKGPKG